jgi:hypothetical protein
MADYSRSTLRALVRQYLGDMSRAGLGEYKEGRLRDTLRFSSSLPGIDLLTDRPTARNHVRSEDGGLLLRAPGTALRAALAEVGLKESPRESHKGLEFGWSMSPSELTDLFATLRNLAGQPTSQSNSPFVQRQVVGGVRDDAAANTAPVPPSRMAKGNFVFVFEPGGVDQLRGLIYAWRITDQDGTVRYCYVGKAESGSQRPLDDYARNVNNLLAGRAYRASKPENFRRVHKRLADAVEWNWPIALKLVRNVEPSEDIFAVEAACALELGCDHWPEHGRK